VRQFSASDYTYVKALYAIEPDGIKRHNQHMAMLLAQNANKVQRRNGKVFKPSDFMLTKNYKSKKQKIKALRAQISRQKPTSKS
jgi:hypothetical protein